MLTAQQDSDTDLRGAAEYIPVRNYLEFKNNLLEASHSIFTKAITLYIEGEEFMVRWDDISLFYLYYIFNSWSRR